MNCPCCSRNMLRHIGQGGLYWYCTTCRQVMPVLSGDGLEDNPPAFSCHKQLLSQGDRPSPSKQYWLYLPLKPEHWKSA